MSDTPAFPVCHTASCDEAATFRVFWPGKSPPPEMCLPCMKQAMGIAQAMGLTLHIEEARETE